MEFLIEQENVVRNSILDHQRSQVIFELTRAMDLLFLWVSFGKQKSKKKIKNELWALYKYGWYETLFLIYGECDKSPKVPLFPSNKQNQNWADYTIQQCGRIAYCKSLLEMNRTGLVDLYMPKENKYHFKLKRQYNGVEAIENNDFFWLREQISTYLKTVIKTSSYETKLIHKQMKECVRCWGNYFIGYDTTPEIDSYYGKEGFLYSQSLFGHDGFSEDVQFGGKNFGLYCKTVEILIGWTLKHIQFSNLLLQKHPELDYRNIVTIFGPVKELAGYLSSALEVEESVAEELIQTITLNSDNILLHSQILGGPPPPLIKISQKIVVKSILGNLSNPYFFLLRELKRLYPKDWDKAVNSREDIFRNDLYQLFCSPRFIKTPKSIILKKNGMVLTDIDAAIFDLESRNLGVFQLKWSDQLATSMRERASKKKNLLNESTKWIQVTLEWFNEKKTKDIINYFSLQSFNVKDINQIYLFIIGRNFAHFSGDEIPDTRAAWGQWPQVLRLFTEQGESNTSFTLEWLHQTLKKDSPIFKTKTSPFKKEEIKFGNTTITISG